MDSAVFEIKEYMIVWRQLEIMKFKGTDIKIRGLVRCTGDEYSLDVYFLTADSPFPAPVFDVKQKKGSMFLSIQDIAAFVDMLRNEKPVFGHLRGDKPEWTSVTTGKEPVGESE